MTIPAQRTKTQQFLFWLQWVLLNTFAWVFSWAVMKYVLKIHPEHPSIFWFFIIGFLTVGVGQWWIIRGIFKDKAAEGFPLAVPYEISEIATTFKLYFYFIPFIIFNIFSVNIFMSQSILYFYIASSFFTDYVLRKYIKPSFLSIVDKKVNIPGLIILIIVILSFVAQLIFNAPFGWIYDHIKLNIYSLSILSFCVSAVISGTILATLFKRLPTGLPQAEPEKKKKLFKRVLDCIFITIGVLFIIFMLIYGSPEAFSPCNYFNSRILGSGCVQSWKNDLDLETISLSPDGSYIAILFDNFLLDKYLVKVYEVESGNLIAELDLDEWVGKWGYSVTMSSSPNNKQIASIYYTSITGNNHLLLWNHNTSEINNIYLENHKHLDEDSIQFSPDGKYLGMIADKEVFVWEVNDGGFGQNYHIAFEEMVQHFNFRKTGDRVTFIVNWEDVYEWDFTSGNPPYIISQGEYRYLITSLNSQDTYLVAWLDGKTLKLWNGEKFSSLIFTEDYISQITAFSPNGEYLLAVDQGKFWVWRTSDGVLIDSQRYENHMYHLFKNRLYVWDISISNSGIVVIRTSDELQVWDIFHDTP